MKLKITKNDDTKETIEIRQYIYNVKKGVVIYKLKDKDLWQSIDLNNVKSTYVY